MNSIKNVIKPINSNKNKLNSKIILIFNLNPNTHPYADKLRRNLMVYQKYVSLRP